MDAFEVAVFVSAILFVDRPDASICSLPRHLPADGMGDSIAIALSLKLAAGYSTSPSGCGAIIGFQGLASQLLQWGVQLLIIMRSAFG
jgi:hypothetical protein